MDLEKAAAEPDTASLTAAVSRVYIAQTAKEAYGISKLLQASPQAR
jgi:hypothetical protein